MAPLGLKLSAAIVVAALSSAAVARVPERIFVSGHSLTDEPLPRYLESIARSRGHALQWNQQSIAGSTIRQRTRGAGTGWPGYATGRNRDGEGLDVRAELRHPRTVSGGTYDSLIITEQHGLLGSIVWDDSVRYLRNYHDRLIAADAGATTYLYQSWLGHDRSDPRRWIDYERAAAPAWACVATRINHSLAAEGRSDRIVPLPAGAALADLVEAAADGKLPGVSVERLFRDDVHLTPMGSYYMALVVYAALYRASPVGSWAPPGMAPATARALQDVAWRSFRRVLPNMDLAACQRYISGSFVGTYLAYQRDTVWRANGVVRAYVKWLRHRVEWARFFAAGRRGNPFSYDPATDRDYWFAAA